MEINKYVICIYFYVSLHSCLIIPLLVTIPKNFRFIQLAGKKICRLFIFRNRELILKIKQTEFQTRKRLLFTRPVMGTLSRFYTGPITNEIILRKPELDG
jgi:hypothetical protein